MNKMITRKFGKRLDLAVKQATTTEMTSSETRGTKELSMKLIVHGENVLNVKSNNRFFRLQEKNTLFHFFGEAFLCYTRDTVAIELELPGGENYKHYTVAPAGHRLRINTE